LRCCSSPRSGTPLEDPAEVVARPGILGLDRERRAIERGEPPERMDAAFADQAARDEGQDWDEIGDWPELNDGCVVHARASLAEVA